MLGCRRRSSSATGAPTNPYAAALAYAQLSASFAGDAVFLDTRFLRQRGDVSRQLLAAVAASRLVLAIIGPAWDDAERRSRLADPRDWVRRELVAADEAGKPIVPVLVDRTDVQRELPFAVPSWLDPVLLASTGFRDTVGALVELVRGHLGNPATRADPSADPVPAAAEAMLRLTAEHLVMARWPWGGDPGILRRRGQRAARHD